MARILSLFRRARLDHDWEDEVAAHLALAAADHVASGMSPDQARQTALRRFGGVAPTKEAFRDSYGFPALELAWRDLQFAWRLLARQPLFAAAAILTVALGVGANTAVVSVLETVLLNPLRLPHADRVMVGRTQFVKRQLFHGETSGVEFRELQSFTDAFSAVAAMEGRAWTWLVDGEASRLAGQAVTPDFLRVFAESPARGHFFTSEDPDCVVLSDALWRTRFGADPSAIGRAMMLDDKPYRIVGVAPADFRFPAQAQLWMPLVLEPGRLLDAERGRNRSLIVLARRKDGVSEAQAADRVARYVDGLKADDAAHGGDLSKDGYDIELTNFGRYVAGDLRRPLLLLWGAAAVVLLTGCANIAGLLLARYSSRRDEIAIRIAVGATPMQIVRQLLIESLLIGVFGGAAGLAVAALAISLLTRLAAPGAEVLALASLNSPLLLYGFGLALLSGLLFGIAPALQAVRRSQTDQLGRSRRRWLQDLFVTAEVCGAFVLIVTTALLLRSLWAVQRVDPGFDPQGVTTAFLIKPQNDPGFFDRLQATLRSEPGVQSVALANPVPFAQSGVISGFSIRDRPEPSGLLGHAEGFQITPDYFQTLHIGLLRGRNLAPSDTETSPLVCLIDARLAEQFFPGEDPIGQEIAMFKGWARIIGVVAAIRGTTLEAGSHPAVYYSFSQIPFFPWAAILVRSTVPADAIIRATVHHTNASVPVYDIKSLDDRIGSSLGIRRAMVVLLSTFGAISLLLAIVGLSGVIAQVVSERTHEIGIRVALGAVPRQILLPLMRQGVQSGVLGLMLGITAVSYAQRWFAGMLFQVGPFDPTTFAATTAGVLMLLLATVWWRARSAAGIDPQRVLRHE